MHAQKYPFAVRLIGFCPDETAHITAALALAPPGGPSYVCLRDDSLQEPDLHIANGDDAPAMARLVATCVEAHQPALVVGSADDALTFPRLPRPLAPKQLLLHLAGLLARRAEALAALTAGGASVRPERRRHPRIASQAPDPLTYHARRRASPSGAVLIVDMGGAFRDHLARLLAARKLAIEWTDSAPTAVRLCDETPVSLVLVNTATPGVDPYGLCSNIKSLEAANRTAVVMLVGPHFRYDAERARAVGVRGCLDKPVADRHLVGTLHKLLSLPAMA